MSASYNHLRNYTSQQLHNQDSGYSESVTPSSESDQQFADMMSYVQHSQHPPTFQSLNGSATTMPGSDGSLDQTLGGAAFFSSTADSNFWDSLRAANLTPNMGQGQGDLWAMGEPTTNMRNGQPTPPQDLMSQGDSGAESKPKSRKRSRTTAEGGPARKSRKSSNIQLEEEDISHLSLEEIAQRQKFLERNRVAASKCRQKKKEWTNSLEEKARDLQGQREMLVAYVSMLRNELLMLKCKCLEHSDCGCVALRDYLKNTVATLPPASADLYGTIQNKDGLEDKSMMHTYNDASYADMSDATQQHSRSTSIGQSVTSPNLDFLNLDVNGQS
ncbi:Mitochondrial-processing peptidase subunit alpha [Venturia nashicola]|uniref:Mitochondrial-processing peptidase subunit alpha n=1 Tax=Venturia nashicola TaxID=86259 RepID=A0A4Z1P413_9PEZI|nr:Mitochondrial-processing peptidase subunit alpha [Venturia nashicola]TLD29493.1 Mitochondrial-processing peptidase subunit alpha [Venturia nashicola]